MRVDNWYLHQYVQSTMDSREKLHNMEKDIYTIGFIEEMTLKLTRRAALRWGLTVQIHGTVQTIGLSKGGLFSSMNWMTGLRD